MKSKVKRTESINNINIYLSNWFGSEWKSNEPIKVESILQFLKSNWDIEI